MLNTNKPGPASELLMLWSHFPIIHHWECLSLGSSADDPIRHACARQTPPTGRDVSTSPQRHINQQRTYERPNFIFSNASPMPGLLFSTGYERWGDHRRRGPEACSKHNRSDGIDDVPGSLFSRARAQIIISHAEWTAGERAALLMEPLGFPRRELETERWQPTSLGCWQRYSLH